MRKLVYIGKDAIGNTVKTESFAEKIFWEGKGYTFTAEMEEISRFGKPDLEKIAKIRAKIAENKAKKAIAKEA